MKKIICLIIIALMAISCSHINVDKNSQDVTVKNQDWILIEKIETERWNKDKIISFLGVPNKVYNDDKKSIQYLIYNDTNTGYQEWSFGVQKSGSLNYITFIPNISNEDNFTTEKIIKIWGKSCNKKTEMDLTQHFIKKIYYIDCGHGHRAYLDNHNEVTSLSIELK